MEGNILFNIGEFNLYPLQGGITNMDGGAMFGVVPRPLWTKKYPCNERNQIPLVCHPILIQNNMENLLKNKNVIMELHMKVIYMVL